MVLRGFAGTLGGGGHVDGATPQTQMSDGSTVHPYMVRRCGFLCLFVHLWIMHKCQDHISIGLINWLVSIK